MQERQVDAPPSSRRTVLLATVLAGLLGCGGVVGYLALHRPAVTMKGPAKLPAAPFAPRLETYRLPEVRHLRRIAGHVGAVFGVAASPDGKLAASASWDGTVKLWSTETWSSVATLGHEGRVADVRFLDGGKTVVSGGGGWLKLWDVSSGKLIRAIAAGTTQVTRIDVDPTGKLLVASGFDGNARVWSLPEFTPRFTLAHSPNAGRAFDARFSPDGQSIATTGDDRLVKLWSVGDGKLLRTLTGHERATTNAAFSSDGTLLASSSDDGSARVFNVADGSLLTTLRAASDETWAIGFSPDGRFVVLGSKDGRIRIYSRPSFSLQYNVPDEARGTTSFTFLDEARFLTTHGSGSLNLWALPSAKARALPETKVLADAPIPATSDATSLAREAERLVDSAEGQHSVLDTAEEQAKQALAKAPKHALALVQLARITYKRSYIGGDKYKPESLEQAHALLDQAIASDPSSFEARESRAWVFIFEKDFERARKAVADAAAIDPERSGARLLKAELANREKAWDEAERQLSLLLEKGASAAHVERAYTELLHTYQGLGEYASMDAVHRRLVALRPKSPWLHGNYALFLVQRGENGRAIELAAEAIALGDYPVVHHYLADAHVQAGIASLWDLDRVDDAKAHFELALAEDPRSADARYGLAAAYRARAVKSADHKLLERSKAELEKTLTIKKDHWWALKALEEHPKVVASLGG